MISGSVLRNQAMLYQEILSRLAACLKSDDRETFITECLSNPLPISPWSLWTLCSLVKHRQRQEFVLHIVRDKLSGDPNALAEAGAFGHPPVNRIGLVPANTDWESQNPHATETGELISMEEYALQRTQDYIRIEMEFLHDRVLPMRTITPPEPPNS
ncbi:hypothetical protein [Gimesia maris]|uniref:hypothetical protein n=1 Tax=Gimesia maris TaxID=122 RepID=UPI0030D91CC0